MRTVFLVSAAAFAAATASPALAEDPCCPKAITPEVITALGEPVGWLVAGQTVHTPSAQTMMGLPVSYIVVVHSGGAADAPVTELFYRLQGSSKPFGQRFALDVRKAFDKDFPGADCEKTSCSMGFKTTATGQLVDAALSEGELSLPKEAHGDGLKLVKADMNLANADPVFVDCNYLPHK